MPHELMETRKSNGPRKCILYCFIQTNDQSNGGVISLLNIAQSISMHDPIFMTQVSTLRTEELKNRGYHVICLDRYNWRNPLLKPLTVLLWNLAVARIIVKHKVSVVHANDNQMVWRTIFSAKLLGTKFVANIRGVFEPGVKYGWNRVWVNFCDRIIVLSQEMRADLIKRLPFYQKGRAEQRVSAIGSIIDDHLFADAMNSARGAKNGFAANVLVVAAFNALKNQHSFLKEAAQWLKQRNICMHFVGDFNPEKDPYSEKCARLVEALDVGSHTVFHGFQSGIQHHYLHADLTLVVSRREGLARCMIESLACGTPVISFDVCSSKEVLVNNNCGVIVKQGDYKQLCAEIDLLLKDHGRLADMSANAVKTAKRLFDKKEIVRQYQEAYQ